MKKRIEEGIENEHNNKILSEKHLAETLSSF